MISHLTSADLRPGLWRSPAVGRSSVVHQTVWRLAIARPPPRARSRLRARHRIAQHRYIAMVGRLSDEANPCHLFGRYPGDLASELRSAVRHGNSANKSFSGSYETVRVRIPAERFARV